MFSTRSTRQTARLYTGDRKIVQASFRQDDTQLISADQGGVLDVWNLGNGERIRSLTSMSPGSTITGLAWLPPDPANGNESTDNPPVAIGWLNIARFSLDLIDPVTGKLTRLPGVAASPARLAYTPDGHYLAASLESDVAVWDLRTLQQLWQSARDPADGRISSLAVSPDGRYIVSAAQQIKVWDLKTGDELANYPAVDENIVSLAFNPFSQVIASGSADGLVVLLPVP